jgi:dienelactone hydrolase
MPPLAFVDAAKIKIPLQAHWATQDEFFKIADVDALEARLTEAGVAEDFVLACGATYCVQLGGSLLLDAAGEACVRTCLRGLPGLPARVAAPQAA